MIRRLALALMIVAAFAGPAEAACTTHLIMGPDGRTIFCMTCCWSGICTTSCS